MRARVRERIRVCVGAMRGADVCMRTHRRAAGLPVRRTKQTPRAGHGATSGSKAHACWAATSHLYLEGAESSAMSGLPALDGCRGRGAALSGQHDELRRVAEHIAHDRARALRVHLVLGAVVPRRHAADAVAHLGDDDDLAGGGRAARQLLRTPLRPEALRERVRVDRGRARRPRARKRLCSRRRDGRGEARRAREGSTCVRGDKGRRREVRRWAGCGHGRRVAASYT